MDQKRPQMPREEGDTMASSGLTQKERLEQWETWMRQVPRARRRGMHSLFGHARRLISRRGLANATDV